MSDSLNPPPPPTHTHTRECMRGPHVCTHFLGKGEGHFLAVASGRFPKKPEKGGVFVITNGNQYPCKIGGRVYPFPEIGDSGDVEQA